MNVHIILKRSEKETLLWRYLWIHIGGDINSTIT